MKKILTLFAVVGLITLSGCSNDNKVDNDTIPQAFEILNKNFAYNATDGYNISGTFRNWVGGNLFDDETILVYRLKGTIDAQTPIWQLIPTTLYLNTTDEVSYDYDFSKEDFKIYVGANYNITSTPQFINNQTFRVVIVPSVLASTLNKNNYLDVMKSLKLNESEIKKVNF